MLQRLFLYLTIQWGFFFEESKTKWAHDWWRYIRMKMIGATIWKEPPFESKKKKKGGWIGRFIWCVCGERSASSLSSGHTQITTEADTRIVWSPFCVCVCFVGQSQTTGGTLLPIPTRIHCCPSSPNGTIQWRRAWGWRVNQTLFFSLLIVRLWGESRSRPIPQYNKNA